jgi:hypothetical protein
MFPTLFYLFILLYEGLFGKPSTEYNAQVMQLNQQIKNHHYQEALKNARDLNSSSLFLTPELERLIIILELKTSKQIQKNHTQLANANAVDTDILLSYYAARSGDTKKGLTELKRSIIQNGDKDTLIKSYELYAFNFPQNKLKKQARSAEMIRQTQKINTQEALSLLDLMKKKQKNFIY